MSRPLPVGLLSLVALVGVASAGATVAGAHPLAPALLEVREVGDGRLQVSFKTSATRLRGTELVPVLPEACAPLLPLGVEPGPGSVTERFVAECGSAELVGARIGVRGLAERRIDALLRVELADGRRLQAVLRGSDPFYEVPARPLRLAVARQYAALGSEHIGTGLDHLLFVFGLLLLVGGNLREVVQTVTAFTIGHSVTLSLAVLGFVRFPTAPIELAIAGSVFLLAVELAREPDARPGWLRRSPWLMAGGFGLLHGLGFAGALAQVGLPADEIPLALFAFNVGIELGQVVVVVVVLAAWRLLTSWRVAAPRWARTVPVYGLGTLAAYWCLQRAAVLLS
jgi:hypothetical protein